MLYVSAVVVAEVVLQAREEAEALVDTLLVGLMLLILAT
jgi:hypothetical protein